MPTTPTYPGGHQKFQMQRQYNFGAALYWLPHIVVSEGRETIYHETYYNIYNVHVLWRDWWWQPSTGCFNLEDLIELVWADNGSVDIGAFPFEVAWNYSLNSLSVPVVSMVIQLDTLDYSIIKFPDVEPESPMRAWFHAPTTPYYDHL